MGGFFFAYAEGPPQKTHKNKTTKTNKKQEPKRT